MTDIKSLSELDQFLAGKTVTVVGIGISNIPLIGFLSEHGASVTARDKKDAASLGAIADDLIKKGIKLILGEGYLSNLNEDVIFKAPGIRYDLPEFVGAVRRGAILTSEMDLFFALCPCPIFGITGSDGKTTTTTLTHLFLAEEAKKKKNGSTVYVGGNIGKPLLPETARMKKDDFAVVELSSFQLHRMKKSPFAAAITNVTPNHLNWHTDMDEYICAKENIFKNPGNERLVLNWGNLLTRGMAKKTSAEVTFFSAKEEPELDDAVCAIFSRDGKILRKTKDGEEILLEESEILLPGRHNIENYMTAIALTWGFVGLDTIRKVASSFGGVEHRCELVCEKKGVKYYNSSIDSSPTRTEAALRSFHEKLIVICGGYDKKIPYEPLAKPLCDCAKKVVLVGATAPKIKEALLSFPDYHGEPQIIEADSFKAACEAARDAATAGDTVILSPASASFDLFKNFEERGNLFKEIVRGFED